jgi:hypothetical protein
MPASTAGTFTELCCHRCGYDLRAHPPDAKCPECGTSVAESRRMAAMPRRPAWQESDPRWRRRMVAGVWILALLPLWDAVRLAESISNLPIPNVLGLHTPLVLSESFLSDMSSYLYVMFCIGVVLLFSKERGRRPGRLEWTRRWGVLCTYVVFLLNVVRVLSLYAIILAVIYRTLMSIPPRYQPEETQLFARVCSACFHYVPLAPDSLGAVIVAFSSVVVLLACVPLFDAMCSCGSKRLAIALLSPLAAFALVDLCQFGKFCLGLTVRSRVEFILVPTYFRPYLLVEGPAQFGGVHWFTWESPTGEFAAEAVKWCSVLAIAILLSIAQFRAWRRRNTEVT